MSGHGYGIGEAGHPLGEWDDDELGGCSKRTAVDALREVLADDPETSALAAAPTKVEYQIEQERIVTEAGAE